MKSSACVLGVLLFTIGAAGLKADPIDPVFSIGDPGSGTPVGTSFAFSSDANGGGVLSFTNASGVTFTQLNFFVTLPASSSITCLQGPFFQACQFSETSLPDGNALFDIGVSIPAASTGGITPGTFFTVNLNDLIGSTQNTDPNGAGGWGADNTFLAVANNAPEPASWPLFGLGLTLVAAGCWHVRRRSA